MNKKVVTIIFFLCNLLPITLYAHNDTPGQQQKIKHIQQGVYHDLKRGDIDHARIQLDEAANNFHSEALELVMVQTLMQTGEYRHALSVAAHTQAEHQDFSDATLMYAWLLTIGGQTHPAKNLLSSSLARHPSASVEKMLTQLNNEKSDPHAFTTENIQLHPVLAETALIKHKRLATGILVDAPYIFTSRVALEKKRSFIIRTSLGRVFNAYLDHNFTDGYLARLIIQNAENLPHPLNIVDKPPFPGIPVYTLGFSQDAKPAWPQLAVDILGSPVEGKDNIYSLNAQDLDYGTGIYNVSGLLTGIVVSDGTKVRKVRMVSNLVANNDSVKSAAARIPVDQVYETALQNIVQIFADN